MDRRTPSSRLHRFFTAYCIRVAYQSGRRAAARSYEPRIADLNQSLADTEFNLSDAEANLADAKAAHAKQLQETIDRHSQEVRELKRQISLLTDSVEIKQQHIAQLSEIITRDRERVAAELAEASRRVEEITNDPNATARPINYQR